MFADKCGHARTSASSPSSRQQPDAELLCSTSEVDVENNSDSVRVPEGPWYKGTVWARSAGVCAALLYLVAVAWRPRNAENQRRHEFQGERRWLVQHHGRCSGDAAVRALPADAAVRALPADIKAEYGLIHDYADSSAICSGVAGRLQSSAQGAPARDADRDGRLLLKLGDLVGAMGAKENRTTNVKEFQDAYRALRHLQGINAKDVLALRETWTVKDTVVLKRLAGQAGARMDGLDVDGFVRGLPTAEDFSELVLDRPCAIVASARSLADSELGREIDEHEVVIRFSGDPAAYGQLDSVKTGSKTTVRVGRNFSEDGAEAEVDLDLVRPWSDYCRALHGEASGGGSARPFVLRPTAVCLLGDAAAFSRRFLFYWLIGRLFAKLDLYGFQRGGSEDASSVGSADLDFEDLVYRIALEEPPPPVRPPPTAAPTGPPPTAAPTGPPTATPTATPPAPPPAPPPLPAPEPPPTAPVPTPPPTTATDTTATTSLSTATDTTLSTSTTQSTPTETSTTTFSATPARGKMCEDILANKLSGRLQMPGVCPGSPGQLLEFETTSVAVRPRAEDADNILVGNLHRYVDSLPDGEEKENFQSALRLLERVIRVNAKDIFALQETWTDADTAVLRRLSGDPGGWVNGELTSTAIRERLPSAGQLGELVSGGRSMAIVGASPSLLQHKSGSVIDGHDQVVRFNDHVGDKLSPNVTGMKTTIHVACDAAGPMGDPSIVEFDLETNKPWNSYCWKVRWGGTFFSNTNYYIMRPTALCAMEENYRFFTRGFLFYWFVGRLFEPDMYGFSGGDGHFDGGGTVWESYLPFEHLVYRFVSGEEHF